MQMDRMAEVRNLYFSYGQEPVLNDIKLSVDRGDFIVFIGPNGSGKSTLLKLMILLMTALQSVRKRSSYRRQMILIRSCASSIS